ncbi:helix-turn-helix transcriptional regulator [Streptomyces sp. ICBB 8177]|uniref:helix-turn-helix transcriptional regulator n=1 Tax=Streptomyces sp. ICBB 8177 TaxID=563922 RepID=UPI000D678DE1|nr:helix-turn-helix transcriptional regulator [Streptomyces sp. ICBB 8177]PWI41881.1 transcriptional regulator [Streptomyces sp. ICBB 8177]
MSNGSSADRPALRVARRLRSLFRAVHPAGRGPWTQEEVAESTGVPAEVIRRLCDAEASDAPDPTDDQLKSVARHFRVPVEFLTLPDDSPQVRAWTCVSRRMNLLFADIYPAGRGPWTHEEVAESSGVPVETIRRLCVGAPLNGDTFAVRLDQLCQRISPATGKPYSNREVGAAVGKSGQYIGNLRAGTNEPGLPVAAELARFFGVSLSYFVHGPKELVARHFRVSEVYLTAEDDSPAVQEIEQSLRTLIALRDERVQRVVGRVLNHTWPKRS